MRASGLVCSIWAAQAGPLKWPGEPLGRSRTWAKNGLVTWPGDPLGSGRAPPNPSRRSSQRRPPPSPVTIPAKRPYQRNAPAVLYALLRLVSPETTPRWP
ncbi:hypothetical protein V6N11_081720 [Hibiscus sabdariffa]|uniref:Secreted protein n=1 Tax=Hibiscus sabdariffa TaxID=183260 RepID=A0ABR2Q710_9ROSI